jgi:cytochrome c oxidase subunit 2
MTDAPTTTPHGQSDGLWRWILGGLAGGLAVLGLLIGAYEVGYHRGHNAGNAAAAPATTSTAAPATTTAPTTTQPAGGVTVTVTPALVARGKALFTSDACAGCHSLTGAAGAGPSLEGVAGGKTTLDTGATVTADDAYLERAITDPDAQIVKGYRPGLMPPAIAGFDLKNKPDDVRALVAFLKSQK